jgi:L-amino acid N-acyltransferase YncA
MTGLTIRPGSYDDWEAIWPFWHEITDAADTYCYDPGTDYEAGRALWFTPAPGETWVAADGGRVVGTYHLGRNQGGPGSHIANASYMVDAAVQGKGVGRAMVQHSLQRARELHFHAIQFNAVAATNAGAIKLYHDLGFVTVGTVPEAFRHPDLGLVDLLVMYRAL